MTLRLPLPVLVAFLLGALVGSFRAQDAVQGPVTAGASPAWVRAVGPFSANTPGFETQFGYDPSDPTHVYVYHQHAWHCFRIDNLP